MNIALVVLQPKDRDTLMTFVDESGLTSATFTCWQVDGEYILAEQLLAPLEAVFHHTPVDMILFPGSHTGDELATRLAWRLRGCAVCQVSTFCEEEGSVSKAIYGNALTAKLKPVGLPLCLSLSENKPHNKTLWPALCANNTLIPEPLRITLSPPGYQDVEHHPLGTAQRVLACGQGAVSADTTRLASVLGAEEGYSRQRVMAGGCDEQRMLGISGQQVAPSLCLVAGASGASAFMAGIAESQFIVAINHDPTAPIFTAADVGIVGDAAEVLDALAACYQQALS